MPCMRKSMEISCSKRKVIIRKVKSIVIKVIDKKEFEIVFSLMTEFGKDSKRLSLQDEEEISFAFLMNMTDRMKEVAGKIVTKKA